VALPNDVLHVSGHNGRQPQSDFAHGCAFRLVAQVDEGVRDSQVGPSRIEAQAQDIVEEVGARAVLVLTCDLDDPHQRPGFNYAHGFRPVEPPLVLHAVAVDRPQLYLAVEHAAAAEGQRQVGGLGIPPDRSLQRPGVYGHAVGHLPDHHRAGRRRRLRASDKLQGERGGRVVRHVALPRYVCEHYAAVGPRGQRAHLPRHEAPFGVSKHKRPHVVHCPLGQRDAARDRPRLAPVGHRFVVHVAGAEELVVHQSVTRDVHLDLHLLSHSFAS